MGRDTAPVLLRLGKGTEDAPLLRFTETRVGGSKTLPLRLRNDTPVTQTVMFERIPREEVTEIVDMLGANELLWRHQPPSLRLLDGGHPLLPPCLRRLRTDAVHLAELFDGLDAVTLGEHPQP